MSQKNQSSKVTTFRRRSRFNIGTVVFGIIFIYMIIMILLYITDQHISVYEVREGTIVKDNTYKGLAIRSEQVVNAPQKGYINYFIAEGTKVGANSKLYTITKSKLDLPESSTKSDELSDNIQSALLAKVQKFNEKYTDSDFANVYTLNNDFNLYLSSKSNISMKKQLTQLKNQNADIHVYSPSSDGLFLMYTDNYENISVDDLSEKDLKMDNYRRTSFSDNTKVTKGDPIYKIVNSENWCLAIELSDATQKELKDTKNIQVRFKRDSETLWANLTIEKKNQNYIGVLSFDSGLIRYSDERFIDIELAGNNVKGLKIPKSSVTTKDFYAIPSDYITQSGGLDGVLLSGTSGSSSFQSITICYSEKDNVYIDAENLSDGVKLLKPNSQDSFTISKIEKVKGVYTVNKGYAVFRRIEIRNASSEYYIVSDNSSYGISEYDHIALDSDTIKENEVVFQ